MVEPTAASSDPPAPALPRGALGAWWAQGLRSALLLRPRWDLPQPTLPLVLLLWLFALVAGLGLERLAIAGPADFYPPALLALGWIHVVLAALVCWTLAPRAGMAPGPLALFAMLQAQAPLLLLAWALLVVPLARSGAFEADAGADLAWGRALWLACVLWACLARAVLLWRAAPQVRPAGRALAIGAYLALAVLADLYVPLRHWYPQRPPPAQDSEQRHRITPEMFDAQAEVLRQRLDALAPQRSGYIDVYAITYAPNADEEVFARESALVAGVAAQRFGAAGRTIELVSRRTAAPDAGWATLPNLQRAVQRVATLMKRDEDVLLIHLTSHGARDGTLAAAFWPLDVEPLTPVRLKAMLDAAGVRFRVISVSACYSGSWIAPLAGDETLVMSAADAEHTSFGCGRQSTLTYFGRAMFDEALRSTRSFEAAHAQARERIAEREQAAGKTDGYSNPQIVVGAAIRPRLQRLEAELAAGP